MSIKWSMVKCACVVCFAQISLAMIGPVSAQDFASVEYMTEDYPPYNMPQGGQASGITTDLLIAAHEAIGAPISVDRIKVLPWARGYNTVQKPGHKALLYSMTRTTEREEMFKWAGPAAPSTVSILTRQDSGIVISAPADLSQYKIGAIREDIGESQLLSAGVPAENITSVGKFTSMINQLLRGRTDIISYDPITAKWLMKNEGMNPNDIITQYTLLDGESYYAFSLAVPDDVVAALQGGIDSVRNSDQLKAIEAKYLGN